VNNRGKVATGTDYFICDFEYQSAKGRFDLIGIKWPSQPQQRKNSTDLTLSVIEVKYADGAFKGKAGLKSHLDDVTRFASKPDNLHILADEMKTVINQKRELGLIDVKKDVGSINIEKVELMFLLANHDPESLILANELPCLQSSPHVDVTFATANFMGYGLYQDCIFPLDDFQGKFEKRIFCKKNQGE
jgi:hypothetical protein